MIYCLTFFIFKHDIVTRRKKDLYKKAYTDDPKKFDNLAWDDKVGIVKALKELNYGVDHESTVVKQALLYL